MKDPALACGSTEAHFSATHWSVVLAASRRDTPESLGALETLCRTYWYPLYAYVRRRGYGAEDSQDLTQEFFARFLSRNYLIDLDPSRGRFRSYLLGAFNHFLSDAWDHAHRQKRFTTRAAVPIECLCAEAQYAHELIDGSSPDRLFDQRWALALLGRALARLRSGYSTMGEEALFDSISGLLTEKAESGEYPRIALELGMSEGALRVALCRMRKRFGELFLEEVAQTVSEPADVRDEMRHLLMSLDTLTP